ncbi:DNA-binding response regulator, AraC family [Lachnospiraceae bacterium KM106-2]|nr:DNA-binding response regulator, AraC family [Lachnospiraceae bacterium KM106-2]
MRYFEFLVDRPMKYMYTGKFVAPSSEWIHKRFGLIDYELFVMTKGTLYISYQGINYTVSDGEYLILPPGEPPNNIREGFKPSDCEFYWLHFKTYHEIRDYYEEEEVGEIPSQNVDIRKRFLIPEQGKIKNPEKIMVLMKQLQDANRSEYDNMTINFMTTVVLGEIYNQIQLTKRGDEKEKKQIYYDIVDYVKGNLKENLRVKEVAKEFGYNEKYLSHIFRQIGGITLKQYILKEKMEMANYLLSDTNKSIADIGSSLGYRDSHNFMSVYKKVTGLTPSEYRNAFAKRLLFHE